MPRTESHLVALQRLAASSFRLLDIDTGEWPCCFSIAMPVAPEVVGRKPRLPAGRGLTREQARLSALGEAVELMSILSNATHRVLPATDIESPRLVANDIALLDEAQLAQMADFTKARNSIAWMHGHELASGRKVALPAQCVLLDHAHVYGEPLVYDADSSGCAAGETLEVACLRALRECIERDALAIWWYGRHHRPGIDIASIGAVGPAAPFIDWLLARKRRAWLCEITTDIGVPVFVALSGYRSDIGAALGCACHDDPRAAALAALLEMVQMEVSLRLRNQGQPDATNPPRAADWAFSRLEEAPARQVDFVTRQVEQPGSELEQTVDRLLARNLSPIAINLTPPDFLCHVARIVVPGLRSARPGFAPGRLFDVPVTLGWSDRPQSRAKLHPEAPL